MLRNGFVLFLLLFTLSLLAQTAEDALRYSFIQPTGTARFAGTAGALTPIGVDFTTLSTNPAGIGWARNGYFVVTPGLGIQNSSSVLTNGTNQRPQDQNVSQFTVPNLGVVFSNETNSLYWPRFNIGIGINRLADFKESFNYTGNSAGSLLESFVEDANDGIFNDFRNNLAFEVDAILEDDEGFFSDFFSNPDGVIRREGTVTRTGGMSEFVVSLGGNYRDRLMWGATLGIPFMNFSETRTYDEIDSDGVIDFFDDLSFDESLETEGSGVNFKIGFILRATQALRVSLAAHSPTFWSIDETYETTFSYAFTDENNAAQGGTALSPQSQFSYNLQTPWRVLLGVGSVIGRSGFVSLDFDYVNYQANRFSYDDFTVEADAVNEEIDNLLTSAFSARLGGEYNFKPYQVRAGIAAQTSPIDGADEVDLLFSAGGGYREGRFFLDFACQYGVRQRIFQPFSTFSLTPQQVDVEFTRLNFLLSGGVFF